MVKKSAKLLVQGTVQGIFFRQFAKENADKLKLKGYARNVENSEVEILVEGEGDAINEFIAIVKKGPQHSQIRNVKFEEKKWTGEHTDFKILKF